MSQFFETSLKGISLGATGWMCFIGIPTCLGLAPAMAAEAVKRDKAWRQWKEAEKKVNQWVSEKNILGTSIRNYDRIISEGDNSILELTRNKSTFIAIRDHMKVILFTLHHIYFITVFRTKTSR